MLISGVKPACILCNKCVAECPEKLFFNDRGTEVVFSDPYFRCIAICPVDAVGFDADEAPLDHPLISTPEKIVGTEELALFMRARRSIRRFESTSVPRESLERVLSAMRYAPTASNRECLHYTVVESPERIRFLLSRIRALFRRIYVLIRILRFFIPFGRKRKQGPLSNGLSVSLRGALERFQAGHDPIFYSAPCLIIISAPAYSHQSGIDAGIALTHGMLAAQAESLGTCLIGFAHETLRLSRRLRRYFRIPRRYQAEGVMVMGYPAVTYKRAPMRKPLSVTWM